MMILQHRTTGERVTIETRPRGAYPSRDWRVIERNVPRPSRPLQGLERVKGRWRFADKDAVRRMLKRHAAAAMDPLALLERIDALEARVAALEAIDVAQGWPE